MLLVSRTGSAGFFFVARVFFRAVALAGFGLSWVMMKVRGAPRDTAAITLRNLVQLFSREAQQGGSSPILQVVSMVADINLAVFVEV